MTDEQHQPSPSGEPSSASGVPAFAARDEVSARVAAARAEAEREHKAYERSRRTAFYTSIAAAVAVIVAMFARGYYDAAVGVAFLAANALAIWALRRSGARWWVAIAVPALVTAFLYPAILYAGPNGSYHRCVDSLTSLPGGADPIAKADAESLCSGNG